MKDCNSLKQFTPFDVQLQCQRYRCNCWYDLSKPIIE
jgi:hypothetical protein